MEFKKQELEVIKKYIENSKIKAVNKFDFENKTVEYNPKIKQHIKINSIRGDEEIVRMYILTKLTNELGYPLERIEIEKEYKSGRPNTITSRIDIIVRDKNNNAFLFIELKSPEEFETDKDKVIEDQLFGLAAVEKGKDGNEVKYLVLYSFDIIDSIIEDKCLIIDYEHYPNYTAWELEHNATDTLPSNYGKAIKEPYIKGGKKDLTTNYTHAYLDSIRKNLHNVLWGGGGTDDNDVFSSLTNLILAKIQDESEKKKGEAYDFQIFAYKTDDEEFESNEELFNRINNLYRRALKQRLYINDEEELQKSYVVDTKKFSMSKLKFAISELERYSFVDGKNSLDGKDILGDFFEGIIRDGFKQSKGQFFTHINIVKFMILGLQLDKMAIEKVNTQNEIPYLIDPSAGSGSFLIEYMKFITYILKYKHRDQLDDSRDIEDKFAQWFLPDNRENKWAQDYIYGVEINFNLGTATKVNMILHGDGSTNIFVKDGLLSFDKYVKETSPNALIVSSKNDVYPHEVNEQFDIILTNPPFSVDLDNETKKQVSKNFIFGSKKNSENLFIERWYQLLRPNGRLAAILPESVFDTTENKYIRIFIFKYFEVKAIVSLPITTFAPYTPTKTSILFARKKEIEEVKKWEALWAEKSKKWNWLKTRALNILAVFDGKKEKSRLRSIKDYDENHMKQVLIDLISDHYNVDEELELDEFILKYRDNIEEFCKIDNDTKDIYGRCNTTWVFSKVTQEINNEILYAETENIGYKRTRRGEILTKNDLFRTNKDGSIIIDDNEKSTILDYLREIRW